MNNKIKEIAMSVQRERHWTEEDIEKFAELIITELRGVLTKEYLGTPLECCGHFLRLDEAILDHFYGLADAPKT